MTRLPELWTCMRAGSPRGRWVSLNEIYFLVSSRIALDSEDFLPQSPSSDIPKWKRNVRNVLQYRKETGEVQWDGNANYQMLFSVCSDI